MKILRVICIAFSLLILTGCETTHYDYRAPASAQGQMCITQCAGIKEQCIGNEISRAQNSKATCERSNDSAMRSCMAKASNKEQEKQCEKNRQYCIDFEFTERCEVNYRACFVNCGGAIIETKQ